MICHTLYLLIECQAEIAKVILTSKEFHPDEVFLKLRDKPFYREVRIELCSLLPNDLLYTELIDLIDALIIYNNRICGSDLQTLPQCDIELRVLLRKLTYFL